MNNKNFKNNDHESCMDSVPLLYIALTAARSVGAITPNNSTNSISDIHTLPLGIFTLPDSLIVMIARPIPIHIKWQIFR